MLVLSVSEGGLISIRDSAGHVLKITAKRLRRAFTLPRFDLVFDDPERHFEIDVQQPVPPSGRV
jgi:hypothetical protein